MKFLEWLYYESLPFVYGALSAFGFANHEYSKLGAVAAVVLAFCSYTVFHKRFYYREFQSRHKTIRL